MQSRISTSLKLLISVFIALGFTEAALAAPDKVILGQLLYFDQNLSINKNQACASCHTPRNFVDPANVADPVNSVVSLGSDRSLHGSRNSPSAAYAAFSPPFHWDDVEALYVGGQFWDGRASSLADQAKQPFLNPVEMALPSKAAVLARLVSEDNPNRDAYKKLFKRVYGVDISVYETPNAPGVDSTYDNLADAIAEFEKTRFFSPFTSKFDYFLAGKARLTAAEQRGLDLFNGKAMCNLCHVSDVARTPDGKIIPPLFTDFTYDNIGIPKSTHPMLANNPPDYGLGGRADIAAVDPTGAERGKFKVMSLRNIAVTPPYAHNGFFATLEDIVHFYNTRDVRSENWPPAEVLENVNMDELGNLGLTAQEEADLVGFLETLTDGYGKPLREIASPALY